LRAQMLLSHSGRLNFQRRSSSMVSARGFESNYSVAEVRWIESAMFEGERGGM
jgi:hypothetical protein